MSTRTIAIATTSSAVAQRNNVKKKLKEKIKEGSLNITSEYVFISDELFFATCHGRSAEQAARAVERRRGFGEGTARGLRSPPTATRTGRGVREKKDLQRAPEPLQEQGGHEEEQKPTEQHSDDMKLESAGATTEMTIDERNKLLDLHSKEFGYVTPLKVEAQRTDYTSSSAARKTAFLTSTSASSSATTVTKRIEKKRELQRRYSDSDAREKPAKGLSDTFDGMALADDDDEELLPAEGHAVPKVEAPSSSTTSSPPPAEEAYWRSMAQMFEMNNRQQENILSDKLLAHRVTIDEETATKVNELEAKIDSNIDEVKRQVMRVTERLTALGNKQQVDARRSTSRPSLVPHMAGRAVTNGSGTASSSAVGPTWARRAESSTTPRSR